jgi:hypothetical protein
MRIYLDKNISKLFDIFLSQGFSLENDVYFATLKLEKCNIDIWVMRLESKIYPV